ncbi:MAG: hypothetical protein JXR73_15555 [Candidatus Omnitrophica bacterium]|nr:hypothetical protein [Candidatus Omnitrophota bacterium]
MFLTTFLIPGALGADPRINLEEAVIVAPANQTRIENNAIDMLLDEVEKRTLIRWSVADAWPQDPVPVIAIARVDSLRNIMASEAKNLDIPEIRTRGEEGYRILSFTRLGAPALIIAGHDERGVLFGCGRLLRELRMSQAHIGLARSIDIDAAPAFPLRGHQMGYRPKTNSYDAWSLPVWEQYLRDLIVFGTNAVELIPPRSDDAGDSPHFPLPQMDMMIRMSDLLDRYGLDVWIWYPAIDDDYSKTGTIEKSLKEWSEVLSKLPRVDAIFVPGGDPGSAPPKILMNLLEKQAGNLRQYHPEAELWVSTQGFHPEWMDEFLDILHQDQPDWLNGIVFGPQNRISLPELRARTPEQYPIRRYPDITHNLRCQYAVQDWDAAYAITEHRESINPRPRAMANIFRLWKDDAIGFLTYSEGCNDDVNKIVWSSLGWDPDIKVIEVLRQYSRYFMGEKYEDAFAQGLLALEKNWEGPLIANPGVYTTLQTFQSMEKNASPQDLLNWRFQQALYRAYYDAFTRRRLIYETQLEESAMDALRHAGEWGSVIAMKEAEDILDQAVIKRPASDWRSRVFELAEALYQSIHMQLSVPRYKAISYGRGANLDLIDRPLNNRNWLKNRFDEIRKSSDEEERCRALDRIVNWTNPGPGGFYDDLGDMANQPRLIQGLGYKVDPEFRQSARVAVDYSPGLRMSWIRFAETRYENPLQMRYNDLDPNSFYRIRVVYAGEMEYHGEVRIRLEIDGEEIHPMMQKPDPIEPLEFDIPRRLTQDGVIELNWRQNAERTGSGRGCQVAEVWLMRMTDS